MVKESTNSGSAKTSPAEIRKQENLEESSILLNEACEANRQFVANLKLRKPGAGELSRPKQR